jgi:hypothetical protein
MSSIRLGACNALHKLYLCCAVIFFATLFQCTVSGQGLPQPTVTLAGHVLEVLRTARRLPKLPKAADEPVTITIMLHWSDPAGFDAYAKSFEDPNSPNFRKTLSPAELTARFGPTQESYDAVLAYLQQNGFTLVNGSANRLTITVRGARAQAERAFAVSIDDYQLGERTFHANTTEPAIPAPLEPVIRSVSGLSNLAEPHPSASPSPSNATSFAAAYNGVVTPAGNGNTGGLPPGLNGSGQTIALIEFDNMTGSDLINSLNISGLPASLAGQVSAFNVNGGTTASEGIGTSEVLLDVTAALGAAPGARIIVFDSYKSNATQLDLVNTAYNGILSVRGASGGVISDSWYSCEYEISNSDADSMESLLQAVKLSGVSFFVATGDYGATCVNTAQGINYPNRIAYPSDAPDAVAVGGTVLQVGAGNFYLSESWWNFQPNPNAFGTGAFGYSWHFPRPSYQDAHTSAPGRSVPDVSADAGDSVPLCQGSPVSCGTFAGTSMAAPFWAGVWTLACQANSAHCPSANGNYLYTALNGGTSHPASTMTGIGNDFTHVGLGSPNITNLVSQIAGPPFITGLSQNSGPITGGTMVVITGGNFIGVTSVQFGGTPAISYTVDSISQITVYTPACPVSSSCYANTGANGTTITIETPAGAGFSPNTLDFHYLASIAGVSPSSGPMEGNTPVTVTGNGFGLGYQVFQIGGVSVGALCENTNQCTMKTPPANAPGTVNVTYNATGAGQFTYTGPRVTSVWPQTGGQNGNTNVLITGTSFAPGMTIKVGNTMITNFACTGDSCSLSTPPGTGTVYIVVTVNGNSSQQDTVSSFTYEPLPYGALQTTSGPGVGGTPIAVFGANFSATPGATTFAFNFGSQVTEDALNVSCISAFICTMQSPPAAALASGFVAQVTATTSYPCPTGGKIGSGGCVGTYSLTGFIGDFTYTSGGYPVGNISPNWGLPAGGTLITVTGSQLTSPLGPTTFTFIFAGSGGSVPALNVSCSSSTMCTMTSPALSPNASGPVATVVGSVNGFTNSMGTFTYGTAAPPPPPPPPTPKPVPPPKCHGICQ